MNCVNLQNTRKIMLFKDSRTKSLSNHLKQTTLHQSQSQLKWLRGHKLHAFICWNNQFDILVGQHRRQTNNKLVMETNRFLVAFTFVRDPSLSRENILDCIVWVNCWSHFYTLVLIFFFSKSVDSHWIFCWKSQGFKCSTDSMIDFAYEIKFVITFCGEWFQWSKPDWTCH